MSLAAVCLSLTMTTAVPAHAGMPLAKEPVTFGAAVCDQVKVTITAPTTGRTTGNTQVSLRAVPYSIVVDGKVAVTGSLEAGDSVTKTVRIPVNKTVLVEVRSDDQIVDSVSRKGIDCSPKPKPKPKVKPKPKPKPGPVCRVTISQGSCGWTGLTSR